MSMEMHFPSAFPNKGPLSVLAIGLAPPCTALGTLLSCLYQLLLWLWPLTWGIFPVFPALYLFQHCTQSTFFRICLMLLLWPTICWLSGFHGRTVVLSSVTSVQSLDIELSAFSSSMSLTLVSFALVSQWTICPSSPSLSNISPILYLCSQSDAVEHLWKRAKTWLII